MYQEYEGSPQKKLKVVKTQESKLRVVIADDCGSGGRGFETHLPPGTWRVQKPMGKSGLFLFLSCVVGNFKISNV